MKALWRKAVLLLGWAILLVSFVPVFIVVAPFFLLAVALIDMQEFDDDGRIFPPTNADLDTIDDPGITVTKDF